MVLTITQEAFNEAVQENINDLGLEPKEALEETIKQFELQGVNLNLIEKVLPGQGVDAKSIECDVKKLSGLLEKAQISELNDQLEHIKSLCEKNLQTKLCVGKAGGYLAILQVLSQKKSDENLVKNCLKTLTSLCSKQPDLLEQKGVDLMMEFLNDSQVAMEIKRLILLWVKECCSMHEMNRQSFINAQIVTVLKQMLEEGNGQILKEALGVCRILLLDDDVRVEFGKAHEHARIIASECLSLIINLMARFQSQDLLVHDLMLTLSALLVRAEFCMTVKEAGGIEVIHDVLDKAKNDKVSKQCFKLLKALAGNDACKGFIIKKDMAPVIFNSLTIHKENVITATAGLFCVAALSLRHPDNSKALFEAGLPEIIVEIMQLHPGQKDVQKAASWAVRNMVSRSRYQNDKFLQLGAGDILQDNLKKFKDIEYDTKAALRDLGCEVDLKEEWTGHGGMLTSEVNKS